MTTAQLIEQLKKVDPEGNTPVCIGNEEIWFCEKLPAYYDGRRQVLTWDRGYPISGTRTSQGHKIKIHSIGIRECFEYRDFQITYESDRDRQQYEAGDLEAKNES